MAEKDPTPWWDELFAKNKKGLEDALAKRRPFDQWLGQASDWVKKNPDLLWNKVTKANVVGAFKAAAINGLLVDGNECMVMIRGKKEPKVQCEIGAQGVIRQAGDAGIYINARTIREGDKIEIDEGAGVVHHTPAWLVKGGKAGGETLGYYAVATFRDGRQIVRAMSWDEAQTRAQGFGPWKTHPDQMGEKSAVLTLRKVLYLGDEIEGLIQSSGIKPDDSWALAEAEQEAADEPTYPPQSTRDKVLAAAGRDAQDEAAEAAQEPEPHVEPEEPPAAGGPI